MRGPVDGTLVPVAQITTFSSGATGMVLCQCIFLCLLQSYLSLGVVECNIQDRTESTVQEGCATSLGCDEPVKTRTLRTEFQIEAYHSQVSVGHNIGVIRNQ